MNGISQDQGIFAHMVLVDCIRRGRLVFWQGEGIIEAQAERLGVDPDVLRHFLEEIQLEARNVSEPEIIPA